MSYPVLRVTPLEWAIAMHESIGGRVMARRHEPAFQARYVPKGTDPVEAYFQATSFGLWQIMGLNIRRLGWTGPPNRWADWCQDVHGQLDFMRRLWERMTDPGDPLWRNVESWNKGDAGEDRLAAPTEYFRRVESWLKKAPAPGPDGLVPLVPK